MTHITSKYILSRLGYAAYNSALIWSENRAIYITGLRVESEDPMILGHESSGIVHSVGKEVESLKPGDRVAVEPGFPCRRCVYCKSGNYALCPRLTFAATPPVDGTLQKYYLAPEDFCYKLPDHVTFEEGALIEPLSVGVEICKRGNVKGGDVVVIFGAGPIGLVVAAVARAYGARKIISVDLVSSKLEYAKRFGGAEVFVPGKGTSEETAKQIIEKFSLGDGADVAIDATGAEACIQTGIYVLKRAGRFVQAGMGKEMISFPITTLISKGIVLVGSFRYSEGCYRESLRLVSDGIVDLKMMITHRFSFKEAVKAFETVKDGNDVLKVMISGLE
ncbi:putative D-xylulose reductase A [Neolecta irregularis DAH-3]|uniref:Putative D-xylulose reductase A n=1 Tax=Neolecta irregularis (strain DAH-3) TaxID=1198029 RepID=A0A1U7LQ69_NEOID|nr:putative D-xylulose reductase A [Neolecta irregularis DAH-3]|eukprot:OLL24692.1 putative D-xylulose reductase A [Neolecta irregularis DAH-3]